MPQPVRRSHAPFLGVGVGLRPIHYPTVLERGPRRALRADFFEVVSENFMVAGGRPLRVLEEVRRFAPLLLHGVSMNLGSVDLLDAGYLDDLGALARRVEPAGVSDHLCWTAVDGRQLHDLLPLPHSEEALSHASERIRRVQDHLGRRIAVENISTYLRFRADRMSEWEWLAGVAEAADCDILLDVNNVFVNARNHGFSPEVYVDAIPAARIAQIHLGGPSRGEGLWIDTHDAPVREEVWSLYERTVARVGPISTLIEWDDRIPDYDRLEAEAERARSILARVALGEGGAGHAGPLPGRATTPTRRAHLRP